MSYDKYLEEYDYKYRESIRATLKSLCKNTRSDNRVRRFLLHIRILSEDYPKVRIFSYIICYRSLCNISLNELTSYYRLKVQLLYFSRDLFVSMANPYTNKLALVLTVKPLQARFVCCLRKTTIKISDCLKKLKIEIKEFRFS